MIDSKLLAIIGAYGLSTVSLLGYLLFIYLNGKRLRKVREALLLTGGH